ncbi:hypothetical protein [Methyloversatilis sp.]|uniref:hypothetical protein n=1 Tax=Methyloversatilis sp. TaxID=2569862 RepID=UPI0035B3A189
MSGVQAAMNEMRAAVSAHLQQCCLELIEMDETGVLPDGKVRELKCALQEHFHYGNDALNVICSEVGFQAMRKATFDEKVAPISIYRIRNDATNLYSTGGRRWNAKGKLFTQSGPVKNALRMQQREIAREREIYGRDERYATHLPSELKVVKYKLVEVEVTSANEFLGVE